jgi:hypothetical protein
MGRMIFALTDEDRAALEAHRVRLGLRSHAETLRALIRSGASEPVVVRIISDEDFSPIEPKPKADKPAPFKSRLKGEWKPR